MQQPTNQPTPPRLSNLINDDMTTTDGNMIITMPAVGVKWSIKLTSRIAASFVTLLLSSWVLKCLDRKDVPFYLYFLSLAAQWHCTTCSLWSEQFSENRLWKLTNWWANSNETSPTNGGAFFMTRLAQTTPTSLSQWNLIIPKQTIVWT